MLVWLVAIVQALGYLLAVPVCAAFCLSTAGGLRFGLGLGAFERRFALRRAWRASLKPKKRRNRREGHGATRAFRALGRLRGVGFSLRGSLGLGDAAATAMACGLLQALAAALGSRAARVEVDVVPLFNAAEPRAELQGMIRVRAGQIITATAVSYIEDLNRRIAKWTDIPSKAS